MPTFLTRNTLSSLLGLFLSSFNRTTPSYLFNCHYAGKKNQKNHKSKSILGTHYQREELLEQYVIWFSQVQRERERERERCCQTMRHHYFFLFFFFVSVSLTLAAFSPFLQVFFAWLSQWKFWLLQKMDWLCLTH